MELTSEDCGSARRVTVRASRIDAGVAIQFKEAVRQAAGDGHGPVVLDLSAVTFLDSSGLGALVGAMKLLGPARPLELAGLTPNVERVFRLTRMDSVFTIHSGAAAAAGPPARPSDAV